MGNCQAAEAATVVIQHPGGKMERMYWSVSASEVMGSNPGHYVAVVVASPTACSEDGTPLRQLKLLRPDDTLHIGHVYRLISFEEVLKEFASKKHVKLSRLLLTQQKEKGNNVEKKKKKKKKKRRERSGGEGGVGSSRRPDHSSALVEEQRQQEAQSEEEEEEELYRVASSLSSMSVSSRIAGGGGGGVGRHGQWRPALQSIAEVGS